MIPLATAAGDVIVDAGKAIDVGKAASGWFRGDPLGVVAVVFASLCLVVGALLVWRTRRFDAREDEHAKQLDAIRADHAKQVDEMRAAMERTNERVIGAFMELVKHDSDGEKT